MINLYEKGAYLVNGTELVDEDNTEKLAQLTGSALSKEEARQNTIAYGILSDHNTSGNMDKLMIKFDTLTSHDITFVGIIQTARASGIEKFSVPYVPLRSTGNNGHGRGRTGAGKTASEPYL